jgi:hypothetical protein
MPARALGQPVADQRRLVGGLVVYDEMHVEITPHIGLDLAEELTKLDGARSTCRSPTRWRCREQRKAGWCRVGCSRGCAERPGRGASAALAGCGRVPGFATSRRQGGELEGLQAVRAEGAPDPPDGGNRRPQVRDAPRELQWVASAAHSPACDDRLNRCILNRARRTRAGLSRRPPRRTLDKASAPLTYRRRLDLEPGRHLLVLRALGARPAPSAPAAPRLAPRYANDRSSARSLSR